MASEAIDEKFLDELLEGDTGFAQELFSTFHDSVAECLECGSQSLEAGDQETSFRAFHTLKGAAASVGLNRLRDVAKEIETRAREGDLATCTAQLGTLRGEVEKGHALLEGYLEKLS